MGTLDWKWIGIGVVVMIVLTLIAGLILGLALGTQLEGVTAPEEVQLGGGQIVLVALLNFLAFAIGGFIVGVKSAGRTILEPWECARRGVAKIEWHPGQLLPTVGFIVTNLKRPAEQVVGFYNQCGTAEQSIKEGKYAIKWTRLS